MRESITIVAIKSTASVLALTLASAATAQSAPVEPLTSTAQTAGTNDAVVGEVVVTATRRAQSISDVPLSVAAFDQQTFDRKGAKSIDDIVRLTPGVSLQPANGGFTRQIAIRGIRSDVGAQPTGIYIDGTPIQVRSLGVATTNFYPTLFDLERVEVLRGPQGTLFGAGAQGGVVRFITPAPSFDGDVGIYARGGVQATEGGGIGYEAGAALGMTLGDNVAFRVSVFTRRDAGFVDQVDRFTNQIVDRNINSQQRSALRAAIAFRLGERLTITPSFFGEIDESRDRGYFWDSFSNPGANRFASAWQKQPSRDEVYLPALKIEFAGNGFDVISETSYFRRLTDTRLDFSTFTPQFFGLALAPFDYRSQSVLTPRQKAFTQELRIQSSNPDSPLQYVFGGFYQRSPFTNLQIVVDPQLPQLTQQLCCSMLAFWGANNIGDLSFIGETEARDRQLAAFGQIDYELVEGLTATIGARYAGYRFRFFNRGQGPLSNGQTTSGETSDTAFTPKFALSYKVSEQRLVYASASKGFRVGGANRTALPPVASCSANLAQLGFAAVPPTFDPDTLWTYEGGAKGSFAGGRARIEASGYYSRWNNIQRNVSLTGCGGGFVGNFGDATVKGFDINFAARLSPRFDVDFALGYTHGVLDDSVFGSRNTATNPPTPRTVAREGDALGVPALQFSAGAEYRTSLIGRDGYLRGDYTFTSQVEGLTSGRNPANALAFDPALTKDDEYHLVSLRAGVRTGGADISVFVDNLLGEAPIIGRYHEAIGLNNFYSSTVRPRTFGATLTYRR